MSSSHGGSLAGAGPSPSSGSDSGPVDTSRGGWWVLSFFRFFLPHVAQCLEERAVSTEENGHGQVQGPGIGILSISKSGELALSMASFLSGISATAWINGSNANMVAPLHYKDLIIPSITPIVENRPASSTSERPYRTQRLRGTAVVMYPRAGHFLEVPYMPHCPSGFHPAFGQVVVFGGEAKAHHQAQLDLWRMFQEFFRKHLDGNNTAQKATLYTRGKKRKKDSTHHPPREVSTGPESDPEEGDGPAPASEPPCEEDIRLPFMEVEALDGPPDTGILTGVPFERVAMDLVGPLVKTARGHQYILVIVDYATCVRGTQASPGFSPFELLYGRWPCGLLDQAKEVWEEQPTSLHCVVEHVEEMRERMIAIWPMVREHMAQAQCSQERFYNRGTQSREFQPGEKILVLILTTESKFLAMKNGPYDIVERVGDINYKVHHTGQRKPLQLYHVNLLKKWHTREVL
eukprot:XP_014048596.1 PREDICTED: uncharacterized protein LOC106601160 [Salmo salar]